MSDSFKPRIDFAGPLEEAKLEQFKTSQAFDGEAAEKFAPVSLDEAENEGQAEASIEAALRPKRSLWRKMVGAGLGLFGLSVVAQGVQWTANAWQTQDWVSLGGCVAGALIIGAGVDRLPPNGADCGVYVSGHKSVMKRAL